MASHVQIGQRLLRAGRIAAEQLHWALAHQKARGGRLGEALVRLGVLSEQDLLTELARQQGVRYVQVGEGCVPPAIVRLVPEKYIRSRRICPIALAMAQGRGKIFIATSTPQDLAILDEVAFITGMTVQPVLVGERDLDDLIERTFGPTGADPLR